MRRERQTLEFVCAGCRTGLAPEEFDDLNLVWPYLRGSLVGPHFLVHKCCLHGFERVNQTIAMGAEELTRLFNPNISSLRDRLFPDISVPLLAFFQPKLPRMYLKFGKDVWGVDGTSLVLLAPEDAAEVVGVKEKLRPNPAWTTLRFMILKRDNYRCRLCGISAKDGEHIRLEVDHITARSKGGTNDPSNLWTLCYDCNHGKGVHDL
jgi:HNH endonuclease